MTKSEANASQPPAPPHRPDASTAVWKNADLVESYLHQVRRNAPLAQVQLDIMHRVIAGRGKPVRNFLDLGCGDGILAASILEKNPEAKGVLVDFSVPMIQEALHKLKAFNRSIHFSTVDYTDPAWFDVIGAYGPFDVIVSGYSIHHQTNSVKQQVYRDIFDLLEPGGVFVNMEHVASNSPWGEALFDEYYIDALWAGQLTEPGAKTRAQVAEAYHQRADKHANKLASVDMQCHWLRRIGFADVDCFFKVFELAVFGGRRPIRRDVFEE